MLRESLKDELKKSMLAKEQRATATLRLILAALKDRDIAGRSKGQTDGIGEDEILSMLQTMIKQRRESIEMYNKGGREELAKQEEEEIGIIERFLPAQMDDAAIEAAIDKAIESIGASGLKEMGKVMAALRDNYAGQMDFAKAGAIAKKLLSG
ncbi:MAG: GatB/YqeY domain-containing protein [Alphaproteobacteria bacterium]|nr:GatB/YqeY domain-containing protein [Alphaproteobacteria bacterium]